MQNTAVYYYSATNKTAVYAQVLSTLFGTRAYELQADLQGRGFAFFAKAALLAVRKKQTPITNMPENIPEEEIYLCAPIWAGNIAAPALYFLNNAPLAGKKINLLLTAAVPDDKYRENALKILDSADCVPGSAYLFAASKEPEPSIIEEHLKSALDSGQHANP